MYCNSLRYHSCLLCKKELLKFTKGLFKSLTLNIIESIIIVMLLILKTKIVCF